MFGLGALLLVVGLVAIVSGVPIVRMEIGWTEIVGGSVAMSAGCVILAMGVLAGQLDAIRQSLAYAALEDAFAGADHPATAEIKDERATAAADDVFADAEPALPEPEQRRLSHPLAPQRWAPVASPVRAEPPLAAAPTLDLVTPEPDVRVEADDAAPTLDEGAPALVHAEEEGSHSPSVLPPDPVADSVADLPALPPPTKAKPNFLSSFLARRGIDAAAPAPVSERTRFDADLPGPAHQPVRTPVDLSSGWDEETRADLADDNRDAPADVFKTVEDPVETVATPVHPIAFDEPAVPEEPAAPPEPEPDPLLPVVVGRYNAGSASYVMYSNGMIEVETEQGTHQFGSMQELKSFIEKRDARVS